VVSEVEQKIKVGNVVDDSPSSKRMGPSASISGVTAAGLIIVLSIFFGFGIWSALAPIAKAVSAPATISVRGERKQIQHLEGGIVAELHIEDGQSVKKGDLLLSLNPLQATATLSRYQNRMAQALMREARLESELADEDNILYKSKLLERFLDTPSVFEIAESEEKQFTARRESFKGTVSILNQRLEQLENEISGLKIQLGSRYGQLAILRDELVDLRMLYEKGFYRKSQILAMERAIVELEGLSGSDTAQIARANSSMGETQRQIINVRQRFREDVVAQLSEIKAEIADLDENVAVAGDVLGRMEIIAPITGVIQGLSVHTIGGVVNSGALLMEIAPKNDDIFVKVFISPFDIDSVEIGQKAEVRLTSLSARTTPTIYGSVAAVSGDSILNPATGGTYFLSRVEISSEELSKLGETKLSPGMPAEVLIQTGERTALQYILKPLADSFARGMNEE
jgi:HlyD family type I secretion membrane fusion protein